MNNSQGSKDAPNPKEQFAGGMGLEERQNLGKPGTTSNQLHPPHLTPNDHSAPVQESMESPDEVPALPANASGTDQVDSTGQPQTIRRESMYDGRPEEDKDQPPSERVRD